MVVHEFPNFLSAIQFSISLGKEGGGAGGGGGKPHQENSSLHLQESSNAGTFYLLKLETVLEYVCRPHYMAQDHINILSYSFCAQFRKLNFLFFTFISVEITL